jgi:diacylglycerol O-acyltransferase / wax synthase
VDTCCIGINIDTAAVPDPDVLTACLREGFEEVLAIGRKS